MDPLSIAKDALGKGFTLALSNGGELITSAERGVKPLLELYRSGRDMSEFSAADKVVGSAAANLYVLLKVRGLYAAVISEGAKKVLSSHGISYTFTTSVPYIQNRAKTGLCPMEEVSIDAISPEDALHRIEARLKTL